MTEISAYDQERLRHINHLMDSIHEHTGEIYEALVDREFLYLQKVAGKLIAELTDIKKSVENEI
jgi:hypothetical protein